MSKNNRLHSGKHVPQDSFEVTNVTLQLAGGFWVEGQVHQNVLTFSLLADLVGQPAAAPDIHFVHAAACFRDPGGYTVDHTFKCGFVQLGLNNANEFIIAQIRLERKGTYD